MEWVEIAETKGWPWLLAIIMVGYILYHFQKLEPRLKEIEAFVRIMQQTVEQNTNAMNSMAQSTDNVSDSLKLLDKTLEGNLAVMRMSIESDQQTQRWMKDHDDRAERMYTKLRIIEQHLSKEKKDAHYPTTFPE